MTETTFVLFAPKAQLSRLRAHLAREAAPEVRWREKRQFAGSEFYVVGPSRLAREAHERAATCLTRDERSVRCGPSPRSACRWPDRSMAKAGFDLAGWPARPGPEPLRGRRRAGPTGLVSDHRARLAPAVDGLHQQA